MNYSVHRKLVNYQNFQNSMLLSSSDTKRTLMFTNSAYSICMQSIRSCNKLYLHYNLGFGWVCVQQMNDKGNLRIMLSNFLSLLCHINLLNLVSMWYSTYSQVHWKKRLIPALGPALAPGGGYPCILQSQPTLSRFNHVGWIFKFFKENFLHFKTVFC